MIFSQHEHHWNKINMRFDRFVITAQDFAYTHTNTNYYYTLYIYNDKQSSSMCGIVVSRSLNLILWTRARARGPSIKYPSLVKMTDDVSAGSCAERPQTTGRVSRENPKWTGMRFYHTRLHASSRTVIRIIFSVCLLFLYLLCVFFCIGQSYIHWRLFFDQTRFSFHYYSQLWMWLFFNFHFLRLGN